MTKKGLNLVRWCLVLDVVFCTTLTVFPAGRHLSLGTPPDVSGDIDCRETGRLNGVVEYQYDVTLINHTDLKQKVDYKVIFFAGDVPIKKHNHSTILIPKENTTESHDGKMKEEDWDRITRFRIETESEPVR
jgi:hypothetical protein